MKKILVMSLIAASVCFGADSLAEHEAKMQQMQEKERNMHQVKDGSKKQERNRYRHQNRTGESKGSGNMYQSSSQSRGGVSRGGGGGRR